MEEHVHSYSISIMSYAHVLKMFKSGLVFRQFLMVLKIPANGVCLKMIKRVA